MRNKIPSIFNNVIGPVMRGPSSSHTAASVRIGLLALKLLGEKPDSAVFRFDPKGSLATTYRGQGSAMGLAAGLLNMRISDPDLINAEEICVKKGIVLEFLIEDTGAVHPNTYACDISSKNNSVSFRAISSGGGVISLIELNGEKIEDDHKYIVELMPVKVHRSPELPFSNIDELLKICKGKKLSDFALQWESSVGDMQGNEVLALAVYHLTIIKDSIETGLAGTEYADRILKRQSHLIDSVPVVGELIPDSVLNSIIKSVSAIMESKSAMELIVAAPTAGSCGTIGGVLIPVAKLTGKTENQLSRALLAGGMTGVFIAQQGGFAAEEGGCQYECGAASGMAAAALCELMGGDAEMAMNAASMALQNTLGMICDPVANRVEVPCLGKNIMAALNALAACNMVIAGFDHVIPLKEVILTMQDVGENMDSKFRCTCKGGLSVSETARKIESSLKK